MCHASPSSKQVDDLSQSKTWLKLLHFDQTDIQPDEYESAITSSTFFLAADGRRDPANELIATIEGLLTQTRDQGDNAIQCRFPARTLWLKKQLPKLLGDLPRLTCSAFTQWSKKGKTHSLSIVYATGFLGNPASFYGHTLLKLNASDNKTTTPLVDTSVNYGALVPKDENPVVYILKGILGGYDGAFSHLDYFYHNHNYGETELRDLWEYELDLSQNQVEFILAHAWEVLGHAYTYYFFNKNCAYRMADLLAVIEGIDIIPHNPVWTMPQSIMQELAMVRIEERPLVKTIKHTPSRQSRFYQAMANLQPAEKSLVKDAIVGEGKLNSEFDQLGDQVKHQVLDTLLHYYQFLRKQHEDPVEKIEQAYQRVLSKRFSVPKGKASFKQEDVFPPHLGRPPSMLRIAWLNSPNGPNNSELTLRPAYYDQLDAENNHIAKASLKMGQLRFLHRGGELSIGQLDLVDVQSVNTRATGLPGDSNSAWKLNVGWHRPTLDCRECLAFNVQADKGYSYNLDDNWLFSGFVGGVISEGNGNFGHYQLRATLELQGQISPELKLLAIAKKNYYPASAAQADERYQISMRYELANNWDIRLHYRKQEITQFGLSLGYYW